MLTVLELLSNVEDPFDDKSMTERAYLRLWVSKFQVVEVYNANVPSALGSAEPLRGALSIACGVNCVVLETAFTEKMLESARTTRERGDLMIATILKAVSLKQLNEKETEQTIEQQDEAPAGSAQRGRELTYTYPQLPGIPS